MSWDDSDFDDAADLLSELGGSGGDRIADSDLGVVGDRVFEGTGPHV